MESKESQFSSNEAGGQALVSQGGPSAGQQGDVPIEPLTLSMLGRFFGVPFVIISIIVTGAVLVVILFGGPATEGTRSVDTLLQTLEAGSGEKSMGILLPREKHLWQAALELAQRLGNKDKELSAKEVTEVSTRLSAMIKQDVKTIELIRAADENAPVQRRIRSARLQYLIHALGRTETPESVETLLDLVRAGEEPFVGSAIRELGENPDMKGDRGAIDAVATALRRSVRAETRIVACTALSVLAQEGDAEAIAALEDARLRFEGEVGWAASLSLARLGSDSGRSTLLDLLDRKFLESPGLYVSTDEDGNVVGRYPLPPERVEATLTAAIDAASKLSDPDLWESIKKLQSDPSLAVRGKATEVLADRS